METETLMTVAVRQRFVSEDEAAPAFASIAEISRMIMSLRKKVLEERKR